MIQVLLTWLLLPLLWLGQRQKPGRPHRILVTQTAKIGDAICTSPLLRELRQDYPDAIITVLAAPLTAPLFRNNPRINDVRKFNDAEMRGLLPKLRLAFELRQQNFDLVLCCNAAAYWPCLLLWAGIPVRVGIAPNYAGTTLRLANGLWTRSAAHRQGRLVMETYGDMLLACGQSAGSMKKEVFAEAGAAAKANIIAPQGYEYIGVAVSSGNKLKELGPAKIADIMSGLLLQRPFTRLVLLGGPADAALARDLLQRHASHADRIIDACGVLALGELPALVNQLSLFIGVDSGLTYMADALDVPLVSVAGPADMADARPLGNGSVIIQSPLPCAPCSHYFRAPYGCHFGTRACVADVAASDVVAAAQALLGRFGE